MSKKVDFLEKLALLQVDFDIWSGKAKLDKDDIKLGHGGEIPPDKLAALGQKNICNPEKLKPFTRIKTKARRLCLGHGMPFMGGFAVPLNKADEIINGLKDISLEFDQARIDFLNHYDESVNQWCSVNQGYEQTIRSAVLPSAVVAKKLGFEYQVYQVSPVDEQQHEKLNAKAASLGDDLLGEVVKEAGNFFHKNLKGRESCDSTTKMSLRNLRDKVDGLSFLNSSFVSVVRLLDKTLAGYDTHSVGRKIIAPFFYQVMAAVLILSSRSQIVEYAEGAIDVDDMASLYTPDTAAELASAIVKGETSRTVEDVPPVAEVVNIQEEPVFADLDTFFDDYSDQRASGDDLFF